MRTYPSHQHLPRAVQRRGDAPSTTTHARIEALRARLDGARSPMPPGTSGIPLAVPTESSFPGPLITPHILLMDPDWEILGHIGHVLGNQGFGVTRSSAILDRQCIERIAPDVIIVAADVEHAATALGFLQASLLGSSVWDTPLVYTTSSIEVAALLAEEAFLTLPKPLSPDALLRVIDTLMVDRMAVKARTVAQGDRQPSTGSRPSPEFTGDHLGPPLGNNLPPTAAWSEAR